VVYGNKSAMSLILLYVSASSYEQDLKIAGIGGTGMNISVDNTLSAFAVRNVHT
jgi:hypothetical protein